MYWSSWVKSQLRAYVCREMRKEDLLKELKYLEEDVQVSGMSFSAMPRAKGLPSSTVERQAERREMIRERILSEMSRIDLRSARMAKALTTLGDVERKVITQCCMSLDHDEDSEIAADMGISLSELQWVKHQAFGTLFDYMHAKRTPEIIPTKQHG